MKAQLAGLALGALLLGGCTQMAAAPDEITLRTDSVPSDCYGVYLIPKGCFQTWRLPENTLYGFISKNEIQGFTYEEGYEYTCASPWSASPTRPPTARPPSITS